MKQFLYFLTKLFWFVFFLFYIFRWHPCQAQNIQWKSFSTAHGLGDVEVYTIYETPSNGDLWFGTRNGATRYNGNWGNYIL